MSFGIKPLGDKVVIKRKEAEEKTAGGILLASEGKAFHRGSFGSGKRQQGC